MKIPIIVISAAALGVLVLDLLNWPTAAQTTFEFTSSSGLGLDPNGRVNIGLEARGHDGTAEKVIDLSVIPKKVWIDQGSIVLIPQTPNLDFWGGLHVKLEAMLFRMWFVSDTGDSIMFFNEILNANFSPANLAIAPYEVDLPASTHWQVKANCGTAGGGRFVDAEVELVGHWQ